MKLLRLTQRNTLLFSGCLLLLTGFWLYFLISNLVEEESTEKLYANAERMAERIRQGGEPVNLPPVLISKIVHDSSSSGFSARDTLVFDPVENEPELFREVSLVREINGIKYKFISRQVALEPHDYLNSIGLALGTAAVVLLLGLWLVTRITANRIWKPFYQNLSALKSFSLENQAPLRLVPSRIQEFQELNAALNTLTQSILDDYWVQKEFSENASHELQTPLAIIRTHLENLLQSPALSEKDAQHLSAAHAATERLSKLNEGLILLTRIQHRQYPLNDAINWEILVQKQVDDLSELAHMRNISIRSEVTGAPRVTGSEILAEILLSNLLSNALRHNHADGRIDILLEPQRITLRNTGPSSPLPEQILFKRFARIQSPTSGTGLGLSIAFQICKLHQWQISYAFKENIHIFQVNF